MREFDEFTITDAVVAKVRQAPDPRMRQVSEAMVRHLHAFVREVEPTFAEWEQAIGFLTRTGHKCDDLRQEFILLSDTLGVSMLVDAINHRIEGRETQSTVLGPFYVANPTEVACGTDISGNMQGMPLYIEGTVADPDGAPLADAIVDIWHSDDDGFYDVQQLEKLGGLAGRARLRTDAQGRFHCWSIHPRFYSIPADGPVGDMLKVQGRHPYRPAHVHFLIDAPGFRRLVTHVFVAGDPYLDSDAVFGVKNSLIRPIVEHPPGVAPDGTKRDEAFATMSYDFRLVRVAGGAATPGS